MSRLLNAARGVSRTFAAGEPESKITVAGQPATVQIRNRLTVNRDDPIPKEVETIFAMEELFRGHKRVVCLILVEARILFFNTIAGISSHMLIHCYSSFHSSEGRAISLEAWQQMRTDVANLHNQLDQLDFAWTEDDQKDSNATTTIINGDAGDKSAVGETAV
jgi:hypothetical protein